MADVVKVELNGQEEKIPSPPPAKKSKLVQARLPFKVLDQKSPSANSVKNKKRKLSESSGTTPPGKVSKTPKNDENAPSGKRTGSVADAENEVSSSSETDAVAKHLTNQKPRPLTLLDRFVRGTQQGDVTTSTSDQPDVVDLTDSPVKSSPSEVTSDKPKTKTAEVNEKDESQNADVDSSSKKVESSDDVNLSSKEASQDAKSVDGEATEAPTSQDSAENESDEKDKQNQDESMDVSTLSMDEDEVSVLENSVTESESEAESPADKNETETPSTPGTPSTAKPKVKTTTKPRGPRSAKQLAEKQKRKEERERIMKERQKQREEAKAEKERLLEEKKAQRKLEKEKKEKEKEELKAKKEKERQEKLQEKEKEKEEKMKQKEEERKKKQEDLDAKNEEKKKKEDERKKKEEDKLRQEQEEANKKNRVAQAFKSFFTKQEKNAQAAVVEETVGGGGIFMAFHLKKDMSLAPRIRAELTAEHVSTLDTKMEAQTCKQLYLKELKRPVKLQSRSKPAEDDEDLIIVEDAPRSHRMHVKFLKFHENHRPAYRGTWRKKSKAVRPCHPLGKDSIMDYEVDSDEEWEEEEPGESLSDSEGEKEEDNDNDEEDEDEENDWMVPHGYLSEGEGADDDDDEPGDPKKMKVIQKQKAQMWEDELKRKAEMPNPVYIGCMWWKSGQNSTPDPNLDLLKQFMMISLAPMPISMTARSELAKDSRKGAASDREAKDNRIRIQPVPDEALPDLVRLVHGNVMGIQKVIREFREYWGRHTAASKSDSSEKNSPGDLADAGESPMETNDIKDQPDSAGPSPTEKTVEFSPGSGAKNCAISKRQLDIKIRQIAVYEKRTDYPKSCWYVHDKILEEHKLTDLPIPTEWNCLTRVKRESGAATPTPTSRCSTPTAASTPTPIHQSIRQFTVPASQLPSPSLIKPVPVVASAADSATPSKSLPSIKQFTVPASELPSPSLPASGGVQETKTNNQTTPKRKVKKVKNITSFFGKNSGQKEKSNSEVTDDPKEGNPPPMVVADDDNDCMIVDAEGEKLPLVAPKGQRTMKSMFADASADAGTAVAEVKSTS